ncbi:MAG: hypothetical protein COB93_03400 [Sneathiella sp.]|nr:MAG: hypothetical protein COB93_03400 [Sneathiella sp.]
MTDNVKDNVKSKSTWTRLLFIILYAITYRVASAVLFAITIIQFIKALITGEPFAQLQAFGGSLAEYNKEVVAYLSYQSDKKPFPVGPWPPQTPPAAKAADEVIIVAEPVEKEPKKPRAPRAKKPSKDDKDDGAAEKA